MRRRLFVIAIAVGLVFAMAPGASAGKKTTGPADVSGDLGGADYEIRVPANWNGTLVVYAHGYRDKADHEGEVDDTSADAFVAEPFEAPMLAAGYALAGSAYSDNGWAVKEAIWDTKRLVNHFHSVFGRPETTILVGFSMGSVVTFESIERFPGIYDGAIPACPVGAGAPRTFDGTLAVAEAYDAVFGWPAAWGTPEDVRDDLDFDTEVLPVILGQFFSPAGFAGFEFIRRVAGIPQDPGFVDYPFSVFFFTTEGRAELERRAGGPVVQNADHLYSLTAADVVVMNALGVTSVTIDGWLGAMNSSSVEAVPQFRRYLRNYADYTGKLSKPVLTLHTVIDGLVPQSHISAYNATVDQSGNSDLVFNAWTAGTSHCAFTPIQLLRAVQAMEVWIEEGDKPVAADFSAAEGFVFPFAPPPWPQP